MEHNEIFNITDLMAMAGVVLALGCFIPLLPVCQTGLQLRRLYFS